ncbi:hypothetical protein AB0G79_17355 [Streptomyces sp. NPDC020807]|uniref:hypothetical protein n=1 Tax=Streptomyces sp. NPDC020807 TaxID=3155119 RepID=UPI0033FDC045
MVLTRLGGRSRLAALAAAAVLALAPAVAGCSDDDTGQADTGNQVASNPPPGMTAQPPDGDEPDDPDAARAEVTKNWETFFDPGTPTSERVELLENGPEMEAVLAAFAGNENAAGTSAEVTEVDFTSDKDADVTYDLQVNGAPALPDAEGTSVLQNDTWKVSVKTLCGLVELSGVTVQGC